MGSGGNLPIGPGLLGFIAVFVLALVLWFLMRNMNSRLRRMSYRERDRQAVDEAAPQVPDDRPRDERDEPRDEQG